jgi:hypothetical protein
LRYAAFESKTANHGKLADPDVPAYFDERLGQSACAVRRSFSGSQHQNFMHGRGVIRYEAYLQSVKGRNGSYPH